MRLKDIKISLTFLALASLALIFSKLFYQRYDLTPLVLNIDESEIFYESTFRAEYTGQHSLYLEIDRLTGDSKEISCMFGVQLQKSDCNLAYKPANLIWEIIEGDNSIASGEVIDNWIGGYWSAGGDGAAIYRFNAAENSIYRLKVKLKVPQIIIDKVNPRAKIRLPAILNKNDAIISGLLELLSLILLGINAIVVVFEIFRAKKRTKKCRM